MNQVNAAAAAAAPARPAAGVARPQPDPEELERIRTTDFSGIGENAIAQMTDSRSLYGDDFQLEYTRAAVHSFAVRECNKVAGIAIGTPHFEPDLDAHGFIDGPYVKCVVRAGRLVDFLDGAGMRGWPCTAERVGAGGYLVTLKLEDPEERAEILAAGQLRVSGENYACSLLRGEPTPPHSPTNVKRRVLLTGLSERFTEHIVTTLAGLVGPILIGVKPRFDKASGSALIIYKWPVQAENAVTLYNGMRLLDLVITARLF